MSSFHVKVDVHKYRMFIHTSNSSISREEQEHTQQKSSGVHTTGMGSLHPASVSFMILKHSDRTHRWNLQSKKGNTSKRIRDMKVWRELNLLLRSSPSWVWRKRGTCSWACPYPWTTATTKTCRRPSCCRSRRRWWGRASGAAPARTCRRWTRRPWSWGAPATRWTAASARTKSGSWNKQTESIWHKIFSLSPYKKINQSVKWLITSRWGTRGPSPWAWWRSRGSSRPATARRLAWTGSPSPAPTRTRGTRASPLACRNKQQTANGFHTPS